MWIRGFLSWLWTKMGIFLCRSLIALRPSSLFVQYKYIVLLSALGAGVSLSSLNATRRVYSGLDYICSPVEFI